MFLRLDVNLTKILKECNRDSIAVTYDLATAKIVLQIQTEEKSDFNHLFVNLGAFHIEMTLLSAFEKVTEEYISRGTIFLE